jgi:pimeloyl-ACP methyl ester carboxylesterase
MRAAPEQGDRVWMTLVTAPDGVGIAVHVSGRGRPLVVVHGTSSDHTTWRLLLARLEPHVTVHAVDRRGRGASGDGPDYSLETECADVRAVVAAAGGGGPVDLFGHSYGGNLAYAAALLGAPVRRLVLYEGWPTPDVAHRTIAPELLDRLEALPDEPLLEAFYRDVAHLSADEIGALRAAPTWPARVAAAHTIPRELRAFGGHAFDPVAAAGITIPVLLVVGDDSPDDIKADPAVVAAALPHAEIRVLKGQRHLAHLTDPGGLADAIIPVLTDDHPGVGWM